MNPIFQNVTIARLEIEGFPDTQAFDEITALFEAGFRSLGCTTKILTNEFSDFGVNLVLGANLAGRKVAGDKIMLPKNTIILNLEQVASNNPWMTNDYIRLLKSFPIWDYNKRNIERLKMDYGIGAACLVEIGYLPVLKQISKPLSQDVDVLFYGNRSPRRERILNGLKDCGLAVVDLENVYGFERDQWIGRSKVVLNMHYYDFGGVAEIVRLSYLLANKKAVVSECGDETDMEDDLRECVMAVPYEALVSACLELVRNDEKRARLSRDGFDIFTRRDQIAFLSDAISKTDVSRLFGEGS